MIHTIKCIALFPVILVLGALAVIALLLGLIAACASTEDAHDSRERLFNALSMFNRSPR